MSKPPRPFLGATKQIGELAVNVTEIELKYGVSAGISLRSLGEDFIPFFEEHEARAERGYEIDDWYRLTPMERALVVAQHKIGIAMKNLQADAEIERSRREVEKGQKT